MYWARSRVLEYLNYVAGRLPQGVTPTLGPDATGVGWVYEYVLEEISMISNSFGLFRIGTCVMN